MNKLKKIFLCILSLIILSTVCFAGCKDDDYGKPCENGKHTYGAYVYQNDATCTTDGTEVAHCTNPYCNAKKTRVSTAHPKTGHSIIIVNEKPATCVDFGTKQHYKCENCDNLYFDKQALQKITDQNALVLEKKAHSIDFVAEIPVSCVEFGVKEHYECNSCHAFYSDENGLKPIDDISSLYFGNPYGHDLVFVQSTYVSCDQQWVEEHYKCNNCDNLFTDQTASVQTSLEQLTFKSHFLELVPEKPFSCTAHGEKEHYECKYCGSLYKDALGEQPVNREELQTGTKPGHNPEFVEASHVSCTTDEVDAHYICNNENCGLRFTDESATQVITLEELTKQEKLGHDIETTTIVKAENNQPGMKREACKRDGCDYLVVREYSIEEDEGWGPNV